ncbi:sensor histidine kinase [Caballeronia humi]|uniref:Signal transduction histidine kinase n=1 Tax=Caballeronia humi TaxID=326474 RepID=A0A158GF39_9BURK|nr:ATP-binding protein [Caballeronia humi]SAL30735.1 putative signal transduction histidine kinase [Caballeronia humi]
MKPSTVAFSEPSLPRCGVQSTARASAFEREKLSALIDAKIAADREVQQLSARVAQLSAELAAVGERVRRSLAQDLHDDAGAALTAARFAIARIETWLPADAPAPCAEALDTARQSIAAACDANHRIVSGLNGPCFEDSVSRALAGWAARFAMSTSLRVSVESSGDERLAQLSDAAALAVFRVAQEALNNVARHAKANNASVRIEGGARFVTLVVSDDGIGMSATARRKRGRFGLAGMRARCAALGGSLRVETPEAGGTTVRARIPLTAPLSAVPTPVRRTPRAPDS